MQRANLGALALIAAMAAAPAMAGGLVNWDTVGNWDIMIDPSLGNGCLMQAEYENGALVRIGFDKLNGGGYLDAFNDSWGDLEDGKIYQVSFDLDGRGYKGEAKGLYLAGVPGADIAFDSVDFLSDIAQRQTLTLYNGDGDEVMTIDLGGTSAALNAMVDCQDAQG